MEIEVKIVVTDTLPLITLAVAQSLDYLLYPALPVIIPDAVYYEATADAGKLGAQRIIDWYHAHQEAVRIEPSEAFQDAWTVVNVGASACRGIWASGPRSRSFAARRLRLRSAVLLSDDRDVRGMVVVDPDRLILLTTWGYLRQLEQAQRIQSADVVIEAVRQAGRNPPTRDIRSERDPEIRDAVRTAIERAHRIRPPDNDKP